MVQERQLEAEIWACSRSSSFYSELARTWPKEESGGNSMCWSRGSVSDCWLDCFPLPLPLPSMTFPHAMPSCACPSCQMDDLFEIYLSFYRYRSFSPLRIHIRARCTRSCISTSPYFKLITWCTKMFLTLQKWYIKMMSRNADFHSCINLPVCTHMLKMISRIPACRV